MDIEVWEKIISFVDKNHYPTLPCPYCYETSLKIDESSFQSRKISPAVAEQYSRKYKEERQKPTEELDKAIRSNEDYGEKHPLLALFVIGASVYNAYQSPANSPIYQQVCFLKCSSCGESVSASGLLIKHDKNNVSKELIKFDHFSPTVPIITISKHVPDNIKSELNDSFKHFHFDPPSAAAKLRRAIEKFCQDNNAKGNNLHRMIESLRSTRPEEAEYLLSLKLVGNEGTHSDGVDEADLLHAYKLFQFVLEFYDRKARFQETKQDHDKINQKFLGN